MVNRTLLSIKLGELADRVGQHRKPSLEGAVSSPCGPRRDGARAAPAPPAPAPGGFSRGWPRPLPPHHAKLPKTR